MSIKRYVILTLSDNKYIVASEKTFDTYEQAYHYMTQAFVEPQSYFILCAIPLFLGQKVS